MRDTNPRIEDFFFLISTTAVEFSTFEGGGTQSTNRGCGAQPGRGTSAICDITSQRSDLQNFLRSGASKGRMTLFCFCEAQ